MRSCRRAAGTTGKKRLLLLLLRRRRRRLLLLLLRLDNSPRLFLSLRYLGVFAEATYEIKATRALAKRRQKITFDASASTVWAVGKGDILVPEVMALVQPAAKFVVMVRDPVDRAYSDYV